MTSMIMINIIILTIYLIKLKYITDLRFIGDLFLLEVVPEHIIYKAIGGIICQFIE